MIVRSDFTPPAWLRNPHLQTLWPFMARFRVRTQVRRERVELPDGDFLDLDWNLAAHGPVVIVLHGLSGSVNSHYARSLLGHLHRRGRRAVLMNFRGAGGEPNRLPRSYHGGETGDLSHVVDYLRRREPETPLAAVGYSLGANVLLKWLGERGPEAPLRAAVAVSVPFDLAKSTERLNRGFSRLYQRHILQCLKRDLLRKARTVPLPFDPAIVKGIGDFRRFDDLITAPLHGFADAERYYRLCSAAGFLPANRVPTLIVHSRDDPFVPADAVPAPSALSVSTTLELTRYGGHVGFVGRGRAADRDGWLDERIGAFLGERLPYARDPGRAAAEAPRAQRRQIDA